ncbi:hypothetical protein FRX31_013222 [Thalictrum thalictroides]|uniref:Transmembrane protein n=1 Tax=Thalictrum thalictroides TaxID=46969 RepID=A0A7J6WJV1_THATH|nr:hypothetical protein FRX31_013222 [Thalictrum thalictroides]
MANPSYTFLVLYLALSSVCFIPSLHARKLLDMKEMVSSLEDSLVLSSFAKGAKVPPSSPSQKGHSMIVNEKLFTMHFASIDRILRSVPSPGVGH